MSRDGAGCFVTNHVCRGGDEKCLSTLPLLDSSNMRSAYGGDMFIERVLYVVLETD